MEKHAPHVHHDHKKTKWNYFYEFLMLFLAVFCGSLGEYELEHIVEGQREKVFIKTLMLDLGQDTSDLRDDIPFWLSVISATDSIREEIELPQPERNQRLLYANVATIRKYNNFEYHDRTIEQLKNGGNFRLIKNKKVSEALIEYDALVKSELRDIEQQSNAIYQELNFTQNKLFSSRYYARLQQQSFTEFDSAFHAHPEEFLIPDRKQDALFEYYNNLEFYRNITKYRYLTNKNIYQEAVALILLVKEEYHIDSESSH